MKWILVLMMVAVSVAGSAEEAAVDTLKANSARMGVSQLCQAMSTFRKEYGTFPKGDYGTIMKLLTDGDNPNRILFFAARKEHFNAKGEFLDPWGTPYRIGSFPTDQPWSYSCGPNRIDEGGGEYSDDIASWR